MAMVIKREKLDLGYRDPFMLYEKENFENFIKRESKSNHHTGTERSLHADNITVHVSTVISSDTDVAVDTSWIKNEITVLANEQCDKRATTLVGDDGTLSTIKQSDKRCASREKKGGRAVRDKQCGQRFTPYVTNEDRRFAFPVKEEGKVSRREQCDTRDTPMTENEATLATINRCNKRFAYGVKAGKVLTDEQRDKRFTPQICLSEEAAPPVGDECGKDFHLDSTLKAHTELHTGGNQNKYKQQRNSSPHKSSLNDHMSTQTENKKFKCETCGKCFGWKITLENHKRTHKGEKLHKCEYCGKEFALKHTLITHIRTHTGEKPFKCEDCGKCFGQGSVLAQHRNQHTGEKRHKCEVCGKGFTRKSNLREHIRIHTKEKPFKCELCGRTFSRKRALAPHVKLHEERRPGYIVQNLTLTTPGFSKAPK